MLTFCFHHPLIFNSIFHLLATSTSNAVSDSYSATGIDTASSISNTSTAYIPSTTDPLTTTTSVVATSVPPTTSASTLDSTTGIIPAASKAAASVVASVSTTTAVASVPSTAVPSVPSTAVLPPTNSLPYTGQASVAPSAAFISSVSNPHIAHAIIPNDTEQLFFTAAESNGQFCIHNLLNTIRTDSTLFGNKTARIKLLSTNTPKYDSHKKKLEHRMFSSIETNPKLKALADMIQDPDNPNLLKRRLYVLCNGSFTTNKQELMNSALLQMSVNFIQIKFVGKEFTTPMEFALAQYQPNVVAKDFRTLFAYFKTCGVNCFSLAKHFNGIGTFHSLLLCVCVCVVSTTTCFYSTCAPLLLGQLPS